MIITKRKIEWIVLATAHWLGSCMLLAAAPNHTETEHFHLFAIFSFVYALFSVLLPPTTSQWRLTYGFMSGLYWLVSYTTFVAYQDHPWFDYREANSCDGPCFGWYTFEFEPPYGLLMAIALFGVVCGLAIVSVVKRLLTLNRRHQRR